MIENILNYIGLVGIEGFVFGLLFWVITYITLESTSMWGALRSALIAEAIGNLPYIFGVPPLAPPSILFTLMAAFVFVYLILKVGELSFGRATYATATTYFVLVALVACA